MGEVELYGSAITGLEQIAANDVQNKFPNSNPMPLRGQVRFNIDIEQIPKALTLRALDNLYAILCDTEIAGLRKMTNEEGIAELKKQVSFVDWSLAVICWQLAHDQQLAGGDQRVKSDMKNFVLEGTSKTTHHDSPKYSLEYKDPARQTNDIRLSFNVGVLQCAVINNALGWVPSMKQFDIEIVLNIRDDQILVMVALNKESLFNRNIISYGPTTVRATICYCMISMADIQPGDIVIDTLCGGGSIVLEGALSGNWAAHFLGGDYHQMAIERCVCNKTYNLDGFTKSPGVCDFSRWDATRLPLKDISVDCIITDLPNHVKTLIDFTLYVTKRRQVIQLLVFQAVPFGKKSGHTEDNRILYPKFLENWARVARPGARLVTLTHDKRSLAKSVSRQPWWSVTQTATVNMGGLPVWCTKFIRTNKRGS